MKKRLKRSVLVSESVNVSITSPTLSVRAHLMEPLDLSRIFYLLEVENSEINFLVPCII
jgi:hypothetical protein